MSDFVKKNKVFMIAEAGVNHNGSLKMAKQLVDVAVAAKADAVKFQTFKPGECTGKFAFMVNYQKISKKDKQEAETRFEQSKRLALPFEDFLTIQDYCCKKGILFLSTPDGKASLDFLVNRLKVPLIKIASTELTHLEFLKDVAQRNKPIILSTGMGTLAEVKTAVRVIKRESSKQLVLLHCTTEYPAPFDEVNLKAMLALKKEFGLTVGYSDHTIGKEATIAAVALGANVIEKHFTLDRALPGPDHKASMNPEELKDLIASIRITERLLGDGIKKPTASELRNIPGVRRGIVAAQKLPKGIVLTKAMLTFKRPSTGLQPEEINRVLGRRLKKDLEEDEVLRWEHVA